MRQSGILRQLEQQHISESGRVLDDVKSIGASIRRARKAAGITQDILADLIGTSARTIHAIETGTGNPSLLTVAAAANAVGLRLRASDD
jgi:putative transcriptional regulator